MTNRGGTVRFGAFARTATAASFACVMLAACSSSDAPAPVTANDAGASSGDAAKPIPQAGGDSGAGAGSDDAATADPYPKGPYGIAVGDVIADRTWVGYQNPTADAVSTTKPYGAYSLGDAHASGKRYALVNLAESLCPGCQKSAKEFNTGAKAVLDVGGLVIEVLETTGFTKQPAKSDLDAWVNKYALPVTAVKDPDSAGTATLTALGPREHAYIIELATMKIVEVITGDNTGIGATSGGKGLASLKTLLAAK